LFLSTTKKLNFFTRLQKEIAGRNKTGQIVVRHRGGGLKQKLIQVDYQRWCTTKWGTCINLIPTTKRKALLMLIKYSNGMFVYNLAPFGMLPGYFVRNCQYNAGIFYEYTLGSAVFLLNAPLNALFYNIELTPKTKALYARAAGTYCTITRFFKEKEIHVIKLPTGKEITLSSYCIVTLGKVSNPIAYKMIVGKAGLNRTFNIRPTVRGVAMNPVDHPHGGRTKTNVPEVTPWGKIAKKGK
jgi:large subunit ribosomal protein L2